MTTVSTISSLLQPSQADLLRQQELRDVRKTGMDAAAKSLDMTSSALKDALRSGASLKDIAASKNVDFAKVQSAIATAAKPQLDQAVQAGSLTSSQATDALSRLTSGDARTPAVQGNRAHGGHHGHHGMGKLVQTGEDAAAKSLGMTSSDLKTALQSGQTLQDVAASKNVDFANVQSAISDAVKPQLDQAVQSGRLTGNQEQEVLSRLTSAGATTTSPATLYSTSGSVSPASDAGLLVNATA